MKIYLLIYLILSILLISCGESSSTFKGGGDKISQPEQEDDPAIPSLPPLSTKPAPAKPNPIEYQPPPLPTPSQNNDVNFPPQPEKYDITYKTNIFSTDFANENDGRSFSAPSQYKPGSYNLSLMRHIKTKDTLYVCVREGAYTSNGGQYKYDKSRFDPLWIKQAIRNWLEPLKDEYGSSIKMTWLVVYDLEMGGCPQKDLTIYIEEGTYPGRDHLNSWATLPTSGVPELHFSLKSDGGKLALLHEMGHAFGLGDQGGYRSMDGIMNTISSSRLGGYSIGCDIHTIKMLYNDYFN